MKGFKPHMMYSKAGKGVKANTYAKHLELKKKGYGHSKPKKKKWLGLRDVLGAEKSNLIAVVCYELVLWSIR